MSEIILTGPSHLKFLPDGHYDISGGVAAPGEFQAAAAEVVGIVIPHADWQARFSRAGAKEEYESSTGEVSETATDETKITFDVAKKTVTLGFATNNIPADGLWVDVDMVNDLTIDITIVVKEGVCTDPKHCPNTTVTAERNLAPI